MTLPDEAAPSLQAEVAGGEPRIPKTLGDLHKTITMAQIAKAAGVSQGAISSLLNDRDYGIRVSEKTRERVFKVCREMGYIPNDLRAVVRMYPEVGEFCLLISSKLPGGLANPLAQRVASAAMGAVSEPSNPLTVAFYDEEIDYFSAPDLLPHPIRSGVCSKFLCLGQPSASLAQTLARRGLPLISLGHDCPFPGVLSLLPDYAQAARLAVQHLFELGHRQIALISGPFGSTDPQVLELNRGLGQACEEFGIPIEAQKIAYGDLSDRAGRHALEELLARKPAPTAIFCLSDAAAAGVLAAAQSRGLSVPQELSVVGCSDDGRALFTYPALTTVHLPAEEMAALACREIDRLVREPGPVEAQKITLKVSLTVRESTAEPKKA